MIKRSAVSNPFGNSCRKKFPNPMPAGGGECGESQGGAGGTGCGTGLGGGGGGGAFLGAVSCMRFR